MRFRPLTAAFAVATTIFASAPTGAQEAWWPYVNDSFGYSIELPANAIGPAEVQENDAGVSLLAEGPVQIDVLGSNNVQNLSPDEFSATIEAADGLREVTYRASGNSWFVLSGFLRDGTQASEDVIFYTKYLFNRDRSAVSAFEISYPASEKDRLDPVVTRIEKSLRAPR